MAADPVKGWNAANAIATNKSTLPQLLILSRCTFGLLALSNKKRRGGRERGVGKIFLVENGKGEVPNLLIGRQQTTQVRQRGRSCRGVYNDEKRRGRHRDRRIFPVKTVQNEAERLALR